ncbi:MAG: NADH:ubiquinone reductase (Na(+)-transporting) subunit C [Bacteroidales bacterium]|nr:NADH:ubiquinone reductase (Na(+)-transporting) subunit C [Bacteroidales bacterium]
MFSNRYIFIYAAILVVVIAALLSTTAKFLQPFQERNVRIEKIQNILASAGIVSTKENAEQLFERHIVTEILIDRHGNIITDDRRAFDMDLKIELRKLDELNAGKSNVEPAFPMFVCELNNEQIFIIPMLGKGLWGPLWGYMSLKDDFNTVVGAVFDHQGETPGLGAEIAHPAFQKQFLGKRIFDDNRNFVSIAVVKGGIANSSKIALEHGVDAVSGGTITSDGLADMIKVCLGNYLNFFKVRHAEFLTQHEVEIVEEPIEEEEPPQVYRPRPPVVEEEPEPQAEEEPVEETPEKKDTTTNTTED